MSKQTKGRFTGQDRRHCRRFPARMAVYVEQGGGEPIAAQNLDISWEGVRFVLPKEALPTSGSMRMTFPRGEGEEFSAIVEIVRAEDLDEAHYLIGARFRSLSTSDQRHLERLLDGLRDTAAGDSAREQPLAPTLEVLLNDGDEIRAKLAELIEGRLSLTVFQRYEPDQSVRFVLSGLTDQRVLRLRARVVDVADFPVTSEVPWPLYDVQLRFEHPLPELKAAAVVAFGMGWLMGAAPRTPTDNADIGACSQAAAAVG